MNGSSRTILILGDAITLGLVTAYGFASHGTLGTAGARILATLIPMLLGWFAAAPFLGLYDLEKARDYRQLWRPVWAMILAAPLAAWLRGAWLGAPVQPLFVLIMAGVGALGIGVWRALYAFMLHRSARGLKA